MQEDKVFGGTGKNETCITRILSDCSNCVKTAWCDKR